MERTGGAASRRDFGPVKISYAAQKNRPFRKLQTRSAAANPCEKVTYLIRANETSRDLPVARVHEWNRLFRKWREA
jgi:hypothetical protein